MTQVSGWLGRTRSFLTSELWTRERSPRALLAGLQSMLQLLVLVFQGFVSDQLLLRASALTFFTLLSLIPMIAIAFSMVGPLGVSEDLAAWVVERVAAGSPEAGRKILEILEGVNFGRLGTVGGALLLATTVLALTNVERALNAIWGVRHQRTWMRRFADYLAVLVVAPLVLGIALSLGTTLQSPGLVRELEQLPGFTALYRTGLRQAPFVFLCVGFAFLYWFLPNTKVRFRSALLGGIAAALLFIVAQRFYVGFQIGVARSNAVFGTFAAFPLLLAWIYLSWAIVLFGAEVAFASQHLPLYRRQRQGEEPGAAALEAMGLAIAIRAARTFQEGRQALLAEGLAEDLGAPVRSVRLVLMRLEQAGILSARGDPERDGYQLGRAAQRISAAEVRAALRGPRGPALENLPEGRALGRVLETLDQREAELLAPLSLAELAGEAVDRDGGRG